VNVVLPKQGRLDAHWSRRFFHFLAGTLVVTTIVFWGDRSKALFFCAIVSLILILFDLMRLAWPSFNAAVLKVYGPLMRHDEVHKPSGQLYYVLGICFCLFVLPPIIATQSILTLAWMDPVAGLMGRKYGKHSWNSWLNKIFSDSRPVGLDMGVKTVEGSLAGFLAAFLAGLVAWGLHYAEFSSWEHFWTQNWAPATVAVFSSVGAFVAMLAETWPSQWDDNINIPFWTGLSLWILALIWGVPV
jgi:dolichol kinase